MAEIEVLEKQTSTAKQKVTELEGALAEKAITIEGLQREVEEGKRVTAEQHQTIA